MPVDEIVCGWIDKRLSWIPEFWLGAVSTVLLVLAPKLVCDSILLQILPKVHCYCCGCDDEDFGDHNAGCGDGDGGLANASDRRRARDRSWNEAYY